jgi:hypothetical protein
MDIESTKSKYQFLLLLQLIKCGIVETQRKGNYCCEKSVIQGLCDVCNTIFCNSCKDWMSLEKYLGYYKLRGDSCSDCRNRKHSGKLIRGITPKLRFQILNRDSFTCRYCGQSAPKVELHVDHIIPISKGGKDSDDNLVTSCQNCNSGKSDMLLSGYEGN